MTKLQRVEVHLRQGGSAVVYPVHPGREWIEMTIQGVTIPLTPEDAHSIGSALCECAVECGYDPEQ